MGWISGFLEIMKTLWADALHMRYRNSEQTMLSEEQSDQGLHCLPFLLHLLW